MIEMRSVPSFDVDEVWHHMESYVGDACEHSHGTLTPESIKDCIKKREMQAMVAVDENHEIVGVMITEIIIAASGVRHLHVVALGGNRFDEWMNEANELLKGWAFSMDAPFVSHNGRRGWIKKLSKIGWREDSVVMTMDIRN